MPSKRPKSGELWEIEPHTRAKLAILRSYLTAYFPILGSNIVAGRLLYIDGFAGPDQYLNHDHGSPTVALETATAAAGAPGWRAGEIECVFIETERWIHDHMASRIRRLNLHGRVRARTRCCRFEDALPELRRSYTDHFDAGEPLFAFIDPFGPSGVPFDLVRDVLRRERSEMLLNFNTGGIPRLAGSKSDKNLVHLDRLFGTRDWRAEVQAGATPADRAARAVNFYSERLRREIGVRYAWAFGMGRSRTPDYYLIFATHHPRGLEKMKEAMRRIRQAGDYAFFDAEAARAARDAASGQLQMFDSVAAQDDPTPYADRLHAECHGQWMSLEEARDFALNRTPFTTPAKILADLERRNLLVVELRPGVGRELRKRSYFPADKVAAVRLVDPPPAGPAAHQQPNLFD